MSQSQKTKTKKPKKSVEFPKIYSNLGLLKNNALAGLIITNLLFIFGIIVYALSAYKWIDHIVALWSIFSVLAITILGGSMLLYANPQVNSEESLKRAILSNIKLKSILVIMVIVANSTLYFWRINGGSIKMAVLLIIALLNISVYAYCYIDFLLAQRKKVFIKKG